MERFNAALAFLGPLTIPELARALKVSQRQVRRLVILSGYGRDEFRRVNPAAPRAKPPRACVAAVHALLGDDCGEVYADWVGERTGYGKSAVYAALRSLGYTSRRGRDAVWTCAAMAAK